MQKHSEDLTLKKIAVIRTDFPEKFGLPRQSGLAETRGIAWTGRLQSSVAALGIFGSEAEELARDGASTETGRKYSYGRICHKISVSTKSNRFVLRSSGGNL